jgi:hypothetical protein
VQFCADRKLFGKPLYDILANWPAEGQEVKPVWVDVETWQIEVLSLFASPTEMKQRTWDYYDRQAIQWLFSDNTKALWAKLLAQILYFLEEAFYNADKARNHAREEEKLTREEQHWYARIDMLLSRLFSCFHGPQQLVFKMLLMQTGFGTATPTGDSTE